MKTTLGTESSSDEQLVEWSLTGVREAFGRIVERYQSLVYSITYSATGSLGLSEDIAQQTFLTAWQKLDALSDATKLRAWLCGIARNLMNNSLRRGQREPVQAAEPLDAIHGLRAPEPSPSAQAVSREEEAILWRALERIPDTYREPLILFYREQQSVERVAQELELSEDAVKQRLSRGRKLLTDEVAAFVEGTLKRTTPGKVFTLGVLAALPVLATSAKAATVALSGAAHHSTTTIGVTKVIIMTTTQKVLIAVTAASVAVAVGTGVHETRRVSRMQEEIRALKQQQEPLTEQVQQLRQERDQARRSLSVLRRENKQPRDQAAQLQGPAAQASTSTSSNSFGGLADMMKDPQMKDMIRAQQKMALNKTYGALFKYLNLPADKLDALKDLILDHEMATMNAGMAMMTGSGSESERKQATEDLMKLQSDYDKKIQDLLGAQNYQAFKDYEATAVERMDVQDFEGTLSGETALTDQQEQDLIVAMHGALNALRDSALLNRQNQTLDQTLASHFSEEGIAEQIKQMEQLQQAYVNRAAAILTPAQLEQFTQWEQQQSATQAAQMKMAAQMFRNKSAPQPPAANQTKTP